VLVSKVPTKATSLYEPQVGAQALVLLLMNQHHVGDAFISENYHPDRVQHKSSYGRVLLRALRQLLNAYARLNSTYVFVHAALLSPSYIEP